MVTKLSISDDVPEYDCISNVLANPPYYGKASGNLVIRENVVESLGINITGMSYYGRLWSASAPFAFYYTSTGGVSGKRLIEELVGKNSLRDYYKGLK